VARRVIGLDVGTNAVTVAELATGTPPRLTAFGQVALPRDAVREGEVVDENAVVEAIRRLRAEVGFRKAPVRVGIATPRLIVRQVEMPVMSREDLAGALRFQAQDLIPIPLDEAVLDFTILDTYTPSGASADEPVMRVLIAAVQQQTVMRLVDAVERAGLPVESVDLVPLALIRSLGATVADNGPGAEGIVSIGGGVTCVAVHETGTPRFVRVLAAGGRALTDAIASTLELPGETAESLKRQIGSVDDEVVNQARVAIERPLGILLDEIRSSLDYYRNQPGASRLLRVQLTGGGAQLAEVRERLAALLGVPVVDATPRDTLQIADIGFDASELPRLDAYLSAAVGLALGDATGMPVMNLLPGRSTRRVSLGGSRAPVVAGVAAAVGLLALLAVPTIARRHHASDLKSKAARIEAQNTQLESENARLNTASNAQQQVDTLKTGIGTVLQSDVSWARMLNEIARTMPNDVWLTTFQGQVAAAAATPSLPVVPPSDTSATSTTTGSTTPLSGSPVTTTPGSSGAAVGGTTTSGLDGTVTFGAVGLDFPSVADWLKRIGQIASFQNVWVPQAEKATLGTHDVVNFQSTADLTDSARSDRASTYLGGPR
jgi:type IV pilus assembly protein PilM